MARTSNKSRRRNDDRRHDSYDPSRDHDRGRNGAWAGDRNGDRSRDRDLYRGPSPPRHDRRPYESDSWRPADSRHDNYAPRGSYDDQRASDSYRPRPPQSDFTFRVEQPAGIASFPPANNYQDRREPRRDRKERRGINLNRRSGRRWQPPVHPSQRALVSGATLNLPEERLNDNKEPARFRDVDELSDDEELDMEISSHSSQSDNGEPSKKRARTTAQAESANAAPKWSNPDPYTALPCPDDATQKRRDVVKLIRKARVEEAEAKPAATTQAEDFISFDLTSEDDEKSAADKGSGHTLNGTSSRPDISQDRSGPLGSRKRTADDEIKPPDYRLKKVSMKPVKGLLTPDWQPKPDEEPCPWAVMDHSSTSDVAFRLHKEIIDFYEYVRPRDFEQKIRTHMVDSLKQAMRRDGRNFASAQVHPFGSFMSGLYLPTADMDLVVCSASYMRGGPPTYLGAKSWLYKFQKLLTVQGVADGDSIEVIAHARIPLVKFVDKMTGLRVDISFENLGGVHAIDTFMRWKEQYPAMPVLVTVVKHYLLMRGLNEPVNGGIGGFSVICLVVSMLQLMPQVQSRSLVPEHHLGEMLLEFFDLYGRQFRHETNAISLTRPVGYIRKNKVATFTYKNTDRLSIVDPNNPANDIAGGSSNTAAILARFHDAYDVIRDKMREVAEPTANGGILDVILKGDYSTFRMQRQYLKHIHEKILGPCSD